MTETTEHVNGYPVNVLSERGKMELDDVVRGTEARRLAGQVLARNTKEFRRVGWQTVGPMAFGVIQQAREEGITIPLDTMIKLRKLWLATTDDELHPIMRDLKTGLAHWIPHNINEIIEGYWLTVPGDDHP